MSYSEVKEGVSFMHCRTIWTGVRSFIRVLYFCCRELDNIEKMAEVVSFKHNSCEQNNA